MGEIISFAASALHTDRETAYAMISLTAFLMGLQETDGRVLSAVLGDHVDQVQH